MRPLQPSDDLGATLAPGSAPATPDLGSTLGSTLGPGTTGPELGATLIPADRGPGPAPPRRPAHNLSADDLASTLPPAAVTTE